MAQNAVLRWLDGRGWLVLSGQGGDETRAMALARAAADGGVAYMIVGRESGQSVEQLLNDLDDLGALAGYLVDVNAEDDITVSTRIAEAGIVILSAGGDVETVRSSLLGAAVAGMQQALERGAVILAEESCAAALGTWIVSEAGVIRPGLSWLEKAVILPNITAASESRAARSVLNTHPSAVAIAVGAGSALALGPDGEIETWGEKRVSIALGSDYSA